MITQTECDCYKCRGEPLPDDPTYPGLPPRPGGEGAPNQDMVRDANLAGKYEECLRDVREKLNLVIEAYDTFPNHNPLVRARTHINQALGEIQNDPEREA